MLNMLPHLPQYTPELVYVGDIQMFNDRHFVEVNTNMFLYGMLLQYFDVFSW